MTPRHGEPASGLSEEVGVRLEEPFLLRGLPPGTCRLQVEPAPETSPLLGPELRLRDAPLVELQVPAPGTVELEFVVERTVEHALTARFPAGVDAGRLRAHLWPEDGGPPLRWTLQPGRGEPATARAAGRLRPGRYLARLHSQASADPPGSASVWAEAFIEVGSSGTSSLSLERGASLAGTAFDTAGEPLRDALLVFACADWARGGEPAWTHPSRTDGAGRYRLVGLPPETELRCSRYPEASLRAGAAGTERVADLRP